MPNLESEILKVELEKDRPRVIRYLHKPTGMKLDGVVPGLGALDYLWIRHSQGMAGPRDFQVHPRIADEEAIYEIAMSQDEGKIRFELTYSLEEETLHMRIRNVTESGDLRLLAIDLETLSMVSNRDPSWSICTSGWERVPFHEFNHGRRRYFDFVSFLRKGLAAAVYSNKAFLPAGIDWVQVYEGDVTSIPVHVLRFPVYCYRVGDELQPDFHGMVGLLQDRNGDGEIDWQDVCHWVRGFHSKKINPLYRNTWVTKISTAAPPDHVYSTFDQCLDMIREMEARARGTVPEGSDLFIVYLSGWQYQGHDSKWPANREVCEACGGKEAIRRLIREASKLGVNVSVHMNWDDMYADSPDFTAEIAAMERDGQMRKGGVWGGGQAFQICSYKDYQAGHARRRMKELLELLPLKDTIHFDVLSCNPWPENIAPGETVISQMENLLLGKWKIIEMFQEEAGLDVTSEGYTRPFLDNVDYFWTLGGGYDARMERYLLHGSTISGGNQVHTSRRLEKIREVILHRAGRGAAVSVNFQADTPIESIMDLYYLVMLPYRALAEKKINKIWEEEHLFGTLFEDDSSTEGNSKVESYSVRDGARLIARDYTTFVPFTDDRNIAYSFEGGCMAYPLPDGWEGRKIGWEPVDARVDPGTIQAEIRDAQVLITLPPHTGVWVFVR